MDATLPVREYLRESDFHDYDVQLSGQEHKRVEAAYFVREGSLEETQVSLYRPSAKDGDPRLWFYGLSGYAQPDDILALMVHDGRLYVANCSNPTILASLKLSAKSTGFLTDLTEDANGRDVPTTSVQGGDDSHGAVSVKNPIVTWLLARQFAQSGGVAVPGEKLPPEHETILGDFPAGVREVLDLVVDSLTVKQESGSACHWCFLIGAPGNGKSEALRVLLDRLGLTHAASISGEQAPRTLPRTWPDKQLLTKGGDALVLINDASIPRRDMPPENSLLHDLMDGLRLSLGSDERTVTLVANINRGVLVREANAIQHREAEDAIERTAVDLVRLLSDAGGHRPLQDEGLFPGSDYYRSTEITLGDQDQLRIRVHAVYLDALSLLEPRPDLHSNESEPGVLTPAPYEPLGGFSGDGHRKRSIATPVGGLIGTLVDAKRWERNGCRSLGGELCPAAEWCPFLANAKWLRNGPLRDSYLDIVRAGEIATNRRFTYRELLAVIAQSTLGPARGEWLASEGDSGPTHPCEWTRATLQTIQDGPNNDGQGEVVARLLSQRIYLGLFPPLVGTAGSGSSPGGVQAAPLYTALRKEAMQRDYALTSFVGMDLLDPAVDLDDWDGLRRTALGAIESMVEVAPSDDERLWSELPDAVSGILDAYAEQFFIQDIASQEEAANPTTKKRTKLLRKWRAQILLRQLGLAQGWFTHKRPVGQWLDAQRLASIGSSAPGELERGLRRLVFTRRRGTDEVTFSPFRPRTYAIDQLSPSEVFLTTRADDLSVKLQTQGDHLVALLQRGGASMGQIVVDLTVTREALIRGGSSPDSFTEAEDSSFSRIERARARLVARLSREATGIVLTDRQGRAFALRVETTPEPLIRVESGSPTHQ